MEAHWDDLKLFLMVAEGGGLSAAAQRTGISAPTIGRRMLGLERVMNRMLFERSRRGYELAADGQTLLEQVRAMQKIADDITRWHAGAFQDPFVGIGGDAWLTRFLAHHSSSLTRGAGDVRYCAHDAHAGLSLVNRDCDIAVLADPPKSGNFAVRRSVDVSYGIYQRRLGAATTKGDDCSMWVSLGKEEARFPADRWVFERYDNEIASWTNSPSVLLEMIVVGLGKGVLPCYIGDAHPGLERVGEPLDELASRFHIVANDDDRRRPEIRTMIERLSTLLEDNRALFAGDCVKETASTGKQGGS